MSYEAQEEMYEAIAAQDHARELAESRARWVAVAAGERSPSRSAYREMGARFAGSCDYCGARVRRGTPIGYSSLAPKGHKVLCGPCLGGLEAGEK